MLEGIWALSVTFLFIAALYFAARLIIFKSPEKKFGRKALASLSGAFAVLVTLPTNEEATPWGVIIFLWGLFAWCVYRVFQSPKPISEKVAGENTLAEITANEAVETHLVYKNRFNEVKPYTVHILETTSAAYEVLDLNAGYEKTFNKENLLGTFPTFEQASTFARNEQKKYSVHVPKKIGANFGSPENKMEICFTGFKRADKEQLIALAERTGFHVRTSVVKRLSALICGYNAGPKKVELAKKYGVTIVEGKEAALDFLGTGEISTTSEM